MKKLSLILLIIAIISCHRDEDKSLNPCLLTQMQAPFGSDTSQVKLRQVLSGGQLIGEFVYQNGYVSEHKQYLKFYDKKANYANQYFKRGLYYPVSYEKSAAEYIPEYQYLSDEMVPLRTTIFDVPKTDSTRKVLQTYVRSFGSKYEMKYIFDRQGYIIKTNILENNQADSEVLTTFIRNAENNVISSWDQKTSEGLRINQTEYEYDSHPNPFYKMGMDWTGDLTVHCLSPNNLIKVTVTKDNGSKTVTNFSYNYHANGYPSKLTSVTKADDIVYALEPFILEFTY